MSFENKEVTLLTWMAIHRDPYFLENTIYSLHKVYGYQVKKVAYLFNTGKSSEDIVQLNKKCSSVEAYLKENGIEYIPFQQNVKDPTSHSDLFASIKKTLTPEKIKSLGDICVNISGGTPAMNAVCLELMNSHFFESAKFYNVQKKSPIVGTITPEQYKSGEWHDIFEKTYSSALTNGEVCEINIIRVASKDTQIINEINENYLNPAPELATYAQNSKAREEVEKDLEKYLHFDMPILILGERGIGKSELIKQYFDKGKTKREFFHINCATLDEGTAGPTIFGSDGHAYTNDSGKAYPGILGEASDKNGVLFLDEIHHLDKKWQRALLTTLEDERHSYKVLSRKGEVKFAERVTFIFASNKPIDQLKDYLDADFLDRISFFVMELPPLSKYPHEIQKHWDETWQKICKKSLNKACPKALWCNEISDFFKDKNNLAGNFRSIQRAAYNILAAEPWDESGKIKHKELRDVLKQIGDFNTQNLSNPDSASDIFSSDTALPFEKDLQGKGWDYNWDNVDKMFKMRIAELFTQKFGSLSKAAKELHCDKNTINNALKALPKKNI